jgi:hypothetical protein
LEGLAEAAFGMALKGQSNPSDTDDSFGGANLGMSSVAKIKANRRNGGKSQGPKTAAGKLKASQNRFLYGFDASQFIAPGEDRAEFRRMAKDVIAEWQPDTPFMRRLVYRLSHQLWQQRRLQLYERFVLGETALVSELPNYLVSMPQGRETFDVLAHINELQMKLDGAIAQSVGLLSELKSRRSQEGAQEQTGKTAADQKSQSGTANEKTDWHNARLIPPKLFE